VTRIFHSLLFRVAMLFVAGFIALQVAILLVAIWPDDRPIMFRLVTPEDAREIVELLEQVPAEMRPLVADATSNAAMRVEVVADIPEGGPHEAARATPRLEERFRRYADALDGRPLIVQFRRDGWLANALRSSELPRGPIRLAVGLRGGGFVIIERVPVVLQQLASRYFAIALVAAIILALLMGLLLWQIIRPLAALVRATDAFREDVNAPDAPLSGAREIRALAGSFNSMKQRIGAAIGERTRVLAAIAHDLRTYLTRIRLRVEHIPDEHRRQQAIADVEDMGYLLDDILLFSREDFEEAASTPVIDVRSEVSAYVETRREIGDDVEVSLPDDPLACRCAPLALRRILANLIDNAIRYGERARVSLASEREWVIIAVTDNGPGVPENALVRLTEPFERLETSRGRHSGGAGLGLAIVKALAHGHGGELILGAGPNGALQAKVKLPAADANMISNTSAGDAPRNG